MYQALEGSNQTTPKQTDFPTATNMIYQGSRKGTYLEIYRVKVAVIEEMGICHKSSTICSNCNILKKLEHNSYKLQ